MKKLLSNLSATPSRGRRFLIPALAACLASALSGCHCVSLQKEGDTWDAKEISILSDSTLANLVCTVSTNGFALEIGEIVTGVSSNAVPVITSTGSAVGSVIGTAVHTAATGD